LVCLGFGWSRNLGKSFKVLVEVELTFDLQYVLLITLGKHFIDKRYFIAEA
jgi:hypothetical protein